MENGIVSVRMPKTLITELRISAKEHHFMDLSEELRYIIKQNREKQQDPYEYELRKLKSEIRKELDSKTKESRIRLISELKNLLEEIKDE